jgi:hypothetical protein
MRLKPKFKYEYLKRENMLFVGARLYCLLTNKRNNKTLLTYWGIKSWQSNAMGWMKTGYTASALRRSEGDLAGGAFRSISPEEAKVFMPGVKLYETKT